MVIDIPPKNSFACVMGAIKGKPSAWIKKKAQKVPKGSFWAKGYFVSTAGADDVTI